MGITASFFGLPRENNLYWTIGNHSKIVNMRLVGICKEIIANDLKEEITATIYEELKDKYEE